MSRLARLRLGILSGGEAIGDGIQKIPFLNALANAFPDHERVWVTTDAATVFAGAMKAAIGDRLHRVVDATGLGQDWRGLIRRDPRLPRFDIAIDTRAKWQEALLARRALRPGLFVSPSVRFALSQRRPPPDWQRPPHLVDRLLTLVELTSGKPADISGRLDLHPAAVAEAARLVPQAKGAIGLVPGAGNRAKCWPLDRFKVLARTLDERGLRPHFLLGPDEAAWVAELGATGAAVLQLGQAAGYPGWELTAALGARFGVVIANDCGTANMLALSDPAMVSLFGPTRAEKFAPRVSRSAVVRAQDFGAEEMTAITVAAVLEAVDRLSGP